MLVGLLVEIPPIVVLIEPPLTVLVDKLNSVDEKNSNNSVDEGTFKSVDGNTLKSVDEDSRWDLNIVSFNTYLAVLNSVIVELRISFHPIFLKCQWLNIVDPIHRFS